jgi:hypothetical protein
MPGGSCTLLRTIHEIAANTIAATQAAKNTFTAASPCFAVEFFPAGALRARSGARRPIPQPPGRRRCTHDGVGLLNRPAACAKAGVCPEGLCLPTDCVACVAHFNQPLPDQGSESESISGPFQLLAYARRQRLRRTEGAWFIVVAGTAYIPPSGSTAVSSSQPSIPMVIDWRKNPRVPAA